MCFSFVLRGRRNGGFNGARLKSAALRSSKKCERPFVFLGFKETGQKATVCSHFLLERPEARTVLCPPLIEATDGIAAKEKGRRSPISFVVWSG
jgi:hypothetical protein